MPIAKNRYPAQAEPQLLATRRTTAASTTTAATAATTTASAPSNTAAAGRTSTDGFVHFDNRRNHTAELHVNGSHNRHRNLNRILFDFRFLHGFVPGHRVRIDAGFRNLNRVRHFFCPRFGHVRNDRIGLRACFRAVIQNLANACPRFVTVLDSITSAHPLFVAITHRFSRARPRFRSVNDRRAGVGHLSRVLFVNGVMNFLIHRLVFDVGFFFGLYAGNPDA